MNSLENLRDLIIYKSQNNENGNWDGSLFQIPLK